MSSPPNRRGGSYTGAFWRGSLVGVCGSPVNFFLNNLLTYRDRRLRGAALIRGLATFYIACSIGLVANVRMAEFLRSLNFQSQLAGGIGLLIGSVWNYGVTSMITWRRQHRR